MTKHFITDAYVGRVLSQIGLLGQHRHGRSDANETALFTRQLTQVLAETYSTEYPEILFRKLLPIRPFNPGAEAILWRGWDIAGYARVISAHATDLPLVDLLGFETSVIPKTIGVAFQYTKQDLLAASMTGFPIDAERAKAARLVVDMSCEDSAFQGMKNGTSVIMTGLANNANVTLVSPITGTWASATPLQIEADVRKLYNAIVIASKGLYKPDTLLVPAVSYQYLLQPWSTTAASDFNVLSMILKNSPYIRNIEQVPYLDTADAAGTGPRMIAYSRNPGSVGFFMGQDFTTEPPQPKDLALRVPCWARHAGATFFRPLSAGYMEGL